MLLFNRQNRIDPGAEFSRIRHSLNLLESHILQTPALRGALSATTSISPPSTATSRTHSQRIPSGSRRLNDFKDPNEKDADAVIQAAKGEAPGMLGQSDPSGFYAGPTSTLSHLIAVSCGRVQALFLRVSFG